MAGYTTINALFRPMSYQEMMAPVAAADTEQKNIEDQESQLNTLASQWQEKLAQEAPGSKVRATYQKYIDDLHSQVDALSLNGLNAGSRKSLADLKARYTSDIVPIEEAYKTRALRADELRQLQMKDPSYLVDRDLGTVPLLEFINNPNLSAKGISGSYLTKVVAEGASQLSKEMRNNPRKWRSILHGQLYETLMQKGFPLKDVMNAIQNNPNAAPELTTLVENAVNMSGIKDWNNLNVLTKGYEFARLGLYNAIGDSQYQLVKNEDYLDPLSRAKLNKMQEEEAAPLPTAYASTHSYFDINQHAPELVSVKNKLFLNGYQTPLAQAFGKTGNTNPIKMYDDILKHNAAISKKLQLMGPYSGLNGANQLLYNALLKLLIQSPITRKEYNYLKLLGINSNDNYKSIRLKMSESENNQSHIYTGYDLNITDYDYVDKLLNRTIQDGSSALTRLNNKFEKADNIGTGSRSGRLLEGDEFKYEKDIKGKIAGIEYVPKAGGLVLFTNNGDKYLINKGAIKDQIDFALHGSEASNYINNYIKLGNLRIRYTNRQGQYVEGTGYDAAQDKIQTVVDAVIPQLTHSLNAVQPNTSTNVYSEKE